MQALLHNLARWFYPIRTGKTFFDYWSLVHFAFWFVIGSTFPRGNRYALMGAFLVLAYGWEVFERYAERAWPTIWLSPESWVNSFLSDPLMCLLGVLLAWYGFDQWRPQ